MERMWAMAKKMTVKAQMARKTVTEWNRRLASTSGGRKYRQFLPLRR